MPVSLKYEIENFVINADACDFSRSRAFACVYCGDTTQRTRDHVIPVSWSGLKRSYAKGDIVPSCRECNTMLGNIPIHCVSGRAAYLAEKLQNKYRKILMMPEWDCDDLSELSSNLNKMIMSAQDMKKYIASRIAHCVKVSFDGHTEKVKEETLDHAIAYKILVDFQSGMKCCDIDIKYKFKPNHSKKILTNKKYSSIVIAFKYDYGIGFDVPIKKHFAKIRKLKEVVK